MNAAVDTVEQSLVFCGREDDKLVDLANVAGQLRASALKQLADIVDENPEAAVGVIRRWLAPQDAT